MIFTQCSAPSNIKDLSLFRMKFQETVRVSFCLRYLKEL